MRTFVCAVTAMLILAVGLIAAEIKGKVVSYDGDKNVVTVSADGKDMMFKITDDTKVLSAKDGTPVKNREKALKNLKADAEVVITYDEGKDVAKELKIKGGKKKDKQ